MAGNLLNKYMSESVKIYDLVASNVAFLERSKMKQRQGIGRQCW